MDRILNYLTDFRLNLTELDLENKVNTCTDKIYSHEFRPVSFEFDRPILNKSITIHFNKRQNVKEHPSWPTEKNSQVSITF